MKLEIGVNAGFGHPIAASELDAMLWMGIRHVRRSLVVWRETPHSVELSCKQFVGHTQLRALMLLNSEGLHFPEEVADWAVTAFRTAMRHGLSPSEFDIEIFNEPNLGAWAKRAYDCARAIRMTHDQLRIEGFAGDIVAGSVSGLEQKCLNYLTALDWRNQSRELVVGIHRYPYHLTSDLTSKGDSREQEFDRLMDIVGTRRVFVTESGPNTWYESWGGIPLWNGKRLFGTTRRLTDIQAAALLDRDLVFWNGRAERNYIYQIKDGTKLDGSSLQGLLRSDGVTTKPQGHAVRTWVMRTA